MRITLSVSLLVLTLAAFATPVKFWWTGDRSQDGQMTMYNPTAQDGDTGIPVSAEDIDGDGRMDAILSAITGDGRNNDRSSCGELHVLFGTDSVRGEVDFQYYDGIYENLFTIWGRSSKDYLGSMHAAADLDEDGIKDLVLGACWADTPGRLDGGEVYLIWGGPHLRNRFADVASATDMQELQTTFIKGAEADDKLGIWVSTGDVDGDTHQDILIGAPRANGFANDGAHDQTGECYVLYGPFARSDTIDLANPPVTQRMTVIFGIDPNDQLGNTCEMGYLNGDQYCDLILGAGAQVVARLGDTDIDYPFETGGAGDGPDNTRTACGEAYIIFGEANMPDTINLAAGMPENSTIFWGAHGIENAGEVAGDCLGEEITVADINGDGIQDVMLGAFRTDGRNNDIFWGGGNFLMYGQYDWPAQVDFRNGLPDSCTAIYGGGVDWLLGDSTPLGDLNGDGYFDIMLGCVHDAGPYGIFKAGTVRIVWGKQELLPQVIDFADLPDTMYVQVVQGAEVSDLLAYWATTGDFNGDGYWDIIPNVMHGDGPLNERNNAGDFHIISGEWMTRHPGQPRFLTAHPGTDRVELSWHDNQERGQDWHIIYRRDYPGGTFDSIGFSPWPSLGYLDLNVTPGQQYEYRIVAVNDSGFRSNPSYPEVALVGGTVNENGLPLIVNGCLWSTYGQELIDLYQDEVLLGAGAPFAFWDLYTTATYPSNVTPIGFDLDSLDEEVFDHPLVLWMLNAFDPSNPNNHDGHKFREFGPTLVQYLQSGGRLVVMGKEMGDWVDDQLEASYYHAVNWGFQVAVTNTAELTPLYPGLNNIGKRASASNIQNLEPFSIDDSGCPLLLYTFNNSDYQWMGALSRPALSDWYNLCYLSTRPYRADPTELRGFMSFLLDSLMDHYPKVENVATATVMPGQIEVSWSPAYASNVDTYTLFRQPATGGAVSTVAVLPSTELSYVDTVASPLTSYNYWLTSQHSDGRESLPSDSALGFSPPTVDPGTMLIVNGLDWATYGTQAYNLYDQHVLQGARPFRFWDLFSTANYPPGYSPIGNGLNGLVDQIWQAGTVIWVFNGFNGDDAVFQAIQPSLESYLNLGGKLVLMGKELDLFLSPAMRSRLGIESFGPSVDWAETDSLWAEHPSLATIGKQTGQAMSLVPQFTPRDAPEVYPVYRLAGSADIYYGVLATDTAGTPFESLFLSIRPYRANFTNLAAAMDHLLDSFLGQTFESPVTGLTISSVSGTQNSLRWSALPGATGYRITRRIGEGLPTHAGTVIGTTTSTTFTDTDALPGGIVVTYGVFPIW
ncbi:MAG: FG-GAP repeat protein [Calditrichaeota bacterium]|nr:FG-GAP repeat protein [Calditrichota bacterium]MCB9365786.1 FG-GAP repeat protein [Calditrichota bacterium]